MNVWKALALLMIFCSSQHVVRLATENPRTALQYGRGIIIGAETGWFVTTCAVLWMAGFFR